MGTNQYALTDSSYPDLIPAYEHERLEALRPYRVLGTPGQGVFNDFVSVVAKLFDVPIALVSLVREHDVVFIGNAGLPEATIVNREDSMCSVAILQEGPAVFEDIASQPCSLINPFTARKMDLKFYAGQALRAAGGMGIGSLCVLDRKPRQLTQPESQLLEQLALVATDLLQLQAAHAVDDTLRARLDGPLHESLTRLRTLAELREWNTTADADDNKRYADSRMDEAQHLAQAMHRELQAALG
ncbi:GAF domain-containing protein [Hymenobacter sp. IS2118]|uniref:GAF domain-containing protein n=1 Tax=Hymenobacter sp. IS2118 TaxID=1505605 RepID=UPI00068B70E5|nr:GAF domain-containing protein [Hymenobacter sp. IS2118]